MLRARLTILCALLPMAAWAVSDDESMEILSVSTFPQQAVLPTCATFGGEPLDAEHPSAKSDLIVGCADGAIIIFQYDSLNRNTPVFRIPLGRALPVDSIRGLRPVSHRAARQDAFAVALQRSTLTLVSTESMRVLDADELPPPHGQYSLAIIEASQRAFVYDESSLLEVAVLADGEAWELAVAPIVSRRQHTFTVVTLADRLLLIDEKGITEVSDAGVETFPLEADVADAVLGSQCCCASAGFTALISSDDGVGRVTIIERGSDGWVAGASVRVAGVAETAITLNETTAVIAGWRRAASGDTVGWIATMSARGQLLAQSDHPVPVEHLAIMDGWVVAHGERDNLSVYTSHLESIWDHASSVEPVSLLVRNFDGLGSADLAVVGVDELHRSRADIDSMRVLLRRDDIFAGAELVGQSPDGTGGVYFQERASATLFVSNRAHLQELLASESERARRSLRRGNVGDARRSAVRARAAASALGLRAEVVELSRVLAESQSLPGRSRRMYIWSAALLAAGGCIAARYARNRRDSTGVLVAGTVALVLGGAIAMILDRPPLFGLLLVGGAVPMVALGGAAGRLRLGYSALTPGAPIEELSSRIMGFRHGGQGDFDVGQGERVSDNARKNITQLAYLAREMMDSCEDAERFGAMKKVLSKSAATFGKLVLPEAAHLARLGRQIDFMVEPLERMETAAGAIDRSLRSILKELPPEPSEFAEHVRAIQEGRQILVDSAGTVCEAVLSNPGCSLNSVLDDVLTLRHEFLSSHDVEVDRKIEIRRSADAVRGSRYVLFTIIENLITNAARAMSSSRKRVLIVLAQSDGHTCRIDVSDTGCGVSSEKLDSLFLEREGAEKGGFGLPYSRRVLGQLGGDISVTSDVGQGTTVHIEIPHWSCAGTGEKHEQET